jgi:hypothetical protein
MYAPLLAKKMNVFLVRKTEARVREINKTPANNPKIATVS